MPITPEEAAAITPEEVDDLARLDQELIGHVKDGMRSGYVAGFQVPSKTSGRVLRELVRQWEEKGWRVQLKNGDQRDPGPFIFVNSR